MFSWVKTVKNLFGSEFSNSVVILGDNGFTPYSYRKYVQEGYLINPSLFGCLKRISDGVGALKWVLYDGDETNPKRKPIEKHPLLELVRRPDPRLSKTEFYRRLTLHAYLEGDGFMFINTAIKKVPKELNLLRPDLVNSLPDGSFKYNASKGEAKIYRPEQLMHIMFYNPLDDFNGISPITAIARSVDVNNAGRKWNYSTLKNAIAMSSWFEIEGDIAGNNRERLEQKIMEKFGGADNAGKPFVLTGGMKAKLGNFSPREMDWMQGINASALEICQALAVPPELLGDSTGRTYSNYEFARLSFYTETILPFGEMIRDLFNSQLTPLYGENLYLDIDRSMIDAIQDNIVKHSAEVRADFMTGLITRNEARRERGLPDLTPEDEAELDGLDEPEPTPKPGKDDDDDDGKKDEDKKGLKSMEIKARRRRQRYKLVEGYRKRFEAYFTQLVKERFKVESGQMQEAILKSTPETIQSNINELISRSFVPEWNSLMTKFYTRVIATIGDSELEQILSRAKSAGKPTIKADAFDPYSEAVQEQVRTVVARKVKDINKTTRQMIKIEIEEGIEEGQTVFDIAKNIKVVYETEMETYRAERIARTETVSTTNFAGQQVAAQSGLKLKKQWISTTDGNTREDHLAMDGVQVDLEEPYVVGGEQLMFPGDSSRGASAENVINCRCAEAYVPIED